MSADHTPSEDTEPDGGALVLRPLAKADEDELRRIHSTSEVSRWWDVPDEDFPWDDR